MAKRIGDDIILDRFYDSEKTLLSQCDGFDMKASYLLVALVFLAQLSMTFLSRPSLDTCTKVDQWLSCLSLLLAGIFLMLELRVDYFHAEDPKEMEAWRDAQVDKSKELKSYSDAPDQDAYLRNRLIQGLIIGAKERILKSEEINATKLDLLRKAHWCIGIALFLDALFLITLF